MKSTSAMPPVEQHRNIATGIFARFSQVAISFAIIAAILFLAAGRLDWIWAWVYLAISLVIIMINATFLLRHSPEMIAERGQPKEMQDWDKLVSGLSTVAQYLALPLIAGLDLRFGWTPDFSIGWHVIGILLFSAGLAFSCWAMSANAFFSTAVRIQHDRGQTVCRSGPYRYVRHPGYVGFILSSFGMALLLGSWWALLPAIVAMVLVIIRTVFEERLLHAELAGYQEYASEVRFRLVPGIW